MVSIPETVLVVADKVASTVVLWHKSSWHEVMVMTEVTSAVTVDKIGDDEVNVDVSPFGKVVVPVVVEQSTVSVNTVVERMVSTPVSPPAALDEEETSATSTTSKAEFAIKVPSLLSKESAND